MSYNKFLARVEYIEQFVPCPYCKNYTLLSIHFSKLIFLCSFCGRDFYFKGVVDYDKKA